MAERPAREMVGRGWAAVGTYRGTHRHIYMGQNNEFAYGVTPVSNSLEAMMMMSEQKRMRKRSGSMWTLVHLETAHA